MRLWTAIYIIFSLWPAQAWALMRVVTTTTDLADFVQQIGGKHVRVQSLAKPNQDLHYIQAKPSYMVKLQRSDLLVTVGLELEAGWLPLLLRGARNPDILPGHIGYLELGPHIDVIEVPKNHDPVVGHVHAMGNPHFWLDPQRVIQIIPVIAQRMGDIEPSLAASFNKNAAAFIQAIQTKLKHWKSELKPYRNTPIVSYHHTFNYFFRRFGLRSAATIENKPGIPPSMKHVSHVARMIKREKIPIIFHEIYYNKKTSMFLANQSKTTMLVVPVSAGSTPVANNYINLIDTIVKQFTVAMRKGNENATG